jgi:hypothetical protein
MAKHSCGLLALAAVCACNSSGLSTRQGRSAQESCARITACSPVGMDFASFGECVNLVNAVELILRDGPSSSNLQRAKANYDCFLAASTCDEIRACSQPTPAQLALCDSAEDDTCSGDVLVACSHDRQRVTAEDCGKAGQVCGSNENGAWCGLAACDPAATPPRCEGDTLFTCQEYGNVLTSEDCTEMGKVCGKRPDGTAGCIGKVSCDGFDSNMRCEGTVGVICEDGSESRHDCTRLGTGWTCEIEEKNGWTSMGCVPVAKECTIAVDETCSGGVIQYCDAGHPASYDCKSAGFSGCTTTAKATALCVR